MTVSERRTRWGFVIVVLFGLWAVLAVGFGGPGVMGGQRVQAALLQQTPPVTDTLTPTPSPSPTPSSIRFAVIGDYGLAGQGEADVAALVHSWQPDFIITTGDNNYPSGSAATIDANVGQYYHDFIFPYVGAYGAGADQNRFFPTLGNHDWDVPDIAPYLNYFTLPGNERYYDFVWGPVHFFALDSDTHEPDGVTSTSIQGTWFQNQIAQSTAPWKLVYMHHSPYSSGAHGSTSWMQWPFQAWGASAVLSGHDHIYERVIVSGFPYFVNGLGGNGFYPFGTPVAGSQVRYNANYGAMLVEADANQITFQFYTRANVLIDSYTLPVQTTTPTATVTPSATPSETATSTTTPTETATPTPSETATSTTTPTETATTTPTETPSPTPSESPTPTVTLTATAETSPTPTPSPTETVAPVGCADFLPPTGVGVEDVQLIADAWYQPAGPTWEPRFDLDQDLDTDIVDIMWAVAAFGKGC